MGGLRKCRWKIQHVIQEFDCKRKIIEMKMNPELHEFLLPYDLSIQKLTIELRSFITDLIPEANELIWDNYNALALAYSKSDKLKDAFCHISVYANHVNFGFNRGAELLASEIELEGKGKLIRHISIKRFDSFPGEIIKNMIWEAVGISEQRNSALIDKKDDGKSIVMSISKRKIRPGKSKS